jgi:hypothetical protein
MANEAGWSFVSPGFREVETDVATVRTFDPAKGYWYDKPLAGPPFTDVTGHVWASKWHDDAHIAGLRRNVEACDHHLAHLDDETPWWMGEPPTTEQRERRRAELENEKAAILAELASLGEDVSGLEPPAKRTTKKK